ncbi:MAG TPA: ABC transporter permease [Isosphaeraceae bacterium]|nr:ABC transporter permease [Isosphaeraceae bacterium]
MRFATLVARNLLRRKVRTALTVAGLAIGIAAVVALLGIAWGFERSFLKIYESKRIDLVVVRAGVSDRLTSNLDEKVGDELRRIKGVRALAGSLMDVVSFEEANLVSVLVNGWEPGSLLFRGIRVLKGRALREGDAKAALLGRVLALNLGKDVGDTVDVAGEPFHVVGIFESDSLFENGGLVVPLAELQRMMGRKGYVSGFVIEADEPDRAGVEMLAHRIESQIPGVAAVPARDFVRSDIQIRLVKAMAWATSVIALVLGSVGILNTMMMAVFERTGEIGVLRALGWRRPRILGLILGEAMAVGLVGSAIGVGLGVLGVRALALEPTSSTFISPDLSPAVLGVGLVLGIGLSLLGGLYPAARAAALDPTEALRHE